ncbi:hypothetical protein ACRRTK_001208 [Alexandromys fortis]
MRTASEHEKMSTSGACECQAHPADDVQDLGFIRLPKGETPLGERPAVSVVMYASNWKLRPRWLEPLFHHVMAQACARKILTVFLLQHSIVRSPAFLDLILKGLQRKLELEVEFRGFGTAAAAQRLLQAEAPEQNGQKAPTSRRSGRTRNVLRWVSTAVLYAAFLGLLSGYNHLLRNRLLEP